MKISSLRHRMRVYFAVHPEWWVWLFSGFIWILLIWNSFIFSIEGNHASNLIACLPVDSFGGEVSTGGILKEPSFIQSIQTRLPESILPWFVMIIAMMFPLLKSAIRHTARSVLRSDREMSMLLFLFGYTLVWTSMGLIFLTLPLALEWTFGSTSAFAQGIVAGIVFFIAAIMSWLPSRSVIMVRCELTMPIRISGWKFYKDCLFYGVTIGVVCLRMCWVVMAALMLAHHTIILMLIVSLIALIERYRVPHESPLPGYGWTAIGCSLILVGFLAGN